MLSFAVWILIGVATGIVATKLVRSKAVDTPWYIALGAVGAVIGGWRYNTSGINLLGGFSPHLNFYSLFVAMAGAAALLFAYHLLFHSMLKRADDNMY